MNFAHFLWILVFFLGKTSTIHIELCSGMPLFVKSSWTDLSLVWFAGATPYFFFRSFEILGLLGSVAGPQDRKSEGGGGIVLFWGSAPTEKVSRNMEHLTCSFCHLDLSSPHRGIALAAMLPLWPTSQVDFRSESAIRSENASSRKGGFCDAHRTAQIACFGPI